MQITYIWIAYVNRSAIFYNVLLMEISKNFFSRTNVNKLYLAFFLINPHRGIRVQVANKLTGQFRHLLYHVSIPTEQQLNIYTCVSLYVY